MQHFHFLEVIKSSICICVRHSENAKHNNVIYLVGFPKEVKTWSKEIFILLDFLVSSLPFLSLKCTPVLLIVTGERQKWQCVTFPIICYTFIAISNSTKTSETPEDNSERNTHWIIFPNLNLESYNYAKLGSRAAGAILKWKVFQWNSKIIVYKFTEHYAEV